MNTHTKGAFYEAFEPKKARAIMRRMDFRYTPKHGSWLNIAENELSSLTRQCHKDRRLGDLHTLRQETQAWHQASNSEQPEATDAETQAKYRAAFLEQLSRLTCPGCGDSEFFG